MNRSRSQSLSQSEDENERCLHANQISESGFMICLDCGQECNSDDLSSEFSKNPSNIYDLFAMIGEMKDDRMDNSSGSGFQIQMQIHRMTRGTVYSEFKNASIVKEVLDTANAYFQKLLSVLNEDNRLSDKYKKRNLRGSSFKGVVHACLFQAYKYHGKSQIPQEIQKKFNLTKKSLSKGIKILNTMLSRSKSKSESEPTITKVEDLICGILKNTNPEIDLDSAILDICEINKKIKNKSRKINRSNPQSVASGLIFYWLKNKDKPDSISRQQFSQRSGLSQITIVNISKEIEKLIN